MVIAGSLALAVRNVTVFWVLGMIIGLCVGPVQASSRSLMVRLAPPAIMTQLFGLYAFSGKITSFICPLLLAWFTVWSGSQRVGMSVIMLFLLVGAGLLVRVKYTK